MKLRKSYLAAALVLILIAAGFKAKSFSKGKDLKVSTANSVQSSQLLEEKAVEISKPGNKGPHIVNYVVKGGDTLESIANSNGISVNSITESNNIKADTVLKIGMQLKFPSIDGVLYKVKSGETLWDIARKYSIEEDILQKTNGVNSPDKLQISQEIIIPGADKVNTVIAEKTAAKKTVAVVKTTSTKKATSAAKAISVKKAANAVKTSIKAASRGGKTSALPGIIWPLYGTITSKFGPRGNEFHTGLDIAAPTGTPYKAALSGKVVFSGWKGNYGNLIILDHGDGIQTYYAHSSKILVNAGQAVSRGEVIGRVGSTGRATGPHLHFEVRRDKEPYNPLLFLP